MKNLRLWRVKKPLCGLTLTAVTALALLLGCASGGSPAIGGLLSLDMAMDAVASEIEANIKGDSEIAVYQITANRSETGEYLVDFLNGKFTERKKLIPLAREKVLEAAAAEHQFQMSGLVSDASAVGIGHYLGAKAVINGVFEQFTDFSQLRVRAIDVLTSMVLTSYPVRIKNNDPILKNITASFGNNAPAPRVTENALAHLNRGKDLFRESKYDATIEEFGKALAIDKELAEAYFYRGTSYGWNGDLDKAIEDLNQAIRLNPNYADAYYNRGYVYGDRGDYDRVIADYTQAIRLNPNNAVFYNYRGIAYYRKNDLDRAIADFEAALRINPNFTNARQNLDFARQQRGR